jgi:dihydropteroate synthase
MLWQARGRSLKLDRCAQIMGVLNVTPDSFSDGGCFMDRQLAVAHAEQMVREGASIIDVGGESSRPGSEPLPIEQEIERVLPVISALRVALPEIWISVDTYKAETARQALHAGADIVNDITAASDPGMLQVIQRFGAGVILMHMRGRPKTMQRNPRYFDVVAEVYQFLQRRLNVLVRHGIAKEQIAIDPGFGFGKRFQDNVALARELNRFNRLGRPVVVGISRKSTLAQLLGDPDAGFGARLWPTVAFTSLLREKGAQIVRVHDVRSNLQALRMTDAILADE